MSHISALDESKVHARFHFVLVKPETLTCAYAHQNIMEVFEVSGADNPDQEIYTKYVAVIEDDGTPNDTGLTLPNWKYPLPGRHERAHAQPFKVLKEKLWHESEHLRTPGHVSTVAPSELKEKTLVIVIGSHSFLMEVADLSLERHGLLRNRLILLLKALAMLTPRKTKIHNSYIYCPVFEKEFYPGNFDSLLAEIRRIKKMTTAEMLASLPEE